MSKLINKVIFESFKKNNFSEIIRLVSKHFPKKIFLIFENEKINFYEFNSRINQTCNFFKSIKLKKGNIVSLYLQNSIEFVILYFACIRYGAIVSPIPYGVSNKQISYFLNLSKSKILITDDKNLSVKVKKILISNYSDFLKKIFTHSEIFKEKKK